ncbi:hypothetical protein PTKIN_Ptkin12aG0205200 [Pterospermum kingtungense]
MEEADKSVIVEEADKSEQNIFVLPVSKDSKSNGVVRSVRNLPPVHFLLKIESYSLLCQAGVVKYESGVFQAGGYKWNLRFYPKGNSLGTENHHISLFLKLAETESLPCGWEVNAKFKLFVFDQIRKNYLTIQDVDEGIRCFDEKITAWGLSRMLSFETFNDDSNGYLVDDCCIFGVEVFVVKRACKMESFSIVEKPFNHIFTWEIENFSQLDKEFYFSEGFVVEGTVWKLLIYPKGQSYSKGEALSVYLHYNGTACLPRNQKVYANFILRVKYQTDKKRKLDKMYELAKQHDREFKGKFVLTLQVKNHFSL